MSQYIGPWIVGSDVPKSDIGYRAIISLDGDTICNPSPMGGRNAKLIAAAPELLDALRWALDQIEDDLDPDHQAALSAAENLVEALS
jgi:hypothetical protein